MQSDKVLAVFAFDVAGDLIDRIKKKCDFQPLEIVSVSELNFSNAGNCDFFLINVDNLFQGLKGAPIGLAERLKQYPCIGIYGFHPSSIESICKTVDLSYLVPANELEHISFAIRRQSEQLGTLGIPDYVRRLQGTEMAAPGTLRGITLANFEIPENEFLDHDQFISILDQYLPSLSRTENGSLALIEIDHFLDNELEESEEQLLEEVMASIKARSRQFDLIGRFGKTRFAFFSTRFNVNAFLVFVEHLRATLSENIWQEYGEYLKLKCSIGICFRDKDIRSTKQLISGAEQACATASIGDGNQVEIYLKDSTVRDASPLKNDGIHITTALTENRFRLIFQPIVPLKDASNESYAVLIRMVDQSGKHITPDRFLPLAEKDRVIGHIDQWVLRRVIELIKESRTTGKPRRFFIKISGQSLIGDQLVRCLFHYLKTAKIDGKALVFQIDYVEYMHNKADLTQFIHAVKKARCQVAFDHFGFGRYSADELKTLGLDYVKIDGTFTRHLLTNKPYRLTVKQVQETAEACGVKTIAKSVENADTLALLWNMGIDAVQGYFIQPPEEEMQFSSPF